PEAPERPRAAQVAEEARNDSLATDEEPEPDRGGERLPAAHLHRVVEERVRPVAGVVARGELEHRRRQDACAVELAPAPQHLDEAREVRERRQVAAGRDLGARDAEESADAVHLARAEEPGLREAGGDRTEARREVVPRSEARLPH